MCGECDWEEALFMADEILEEWTSNDFVESVRDWIEEHAHVTGRQRASLLDLHNRAMEND